MTSAFASRLGLGEGSWSVAFQSRFGPQKWLSPYTDKELDRLGRVQLTSLQVVCPGFAVDCLETLDEIAYHGADIFHSAGGGNFQYIPALNDSQAHVDMFVDIALAYD